jgi:phosphopantetheine adenylyltransferase
VFAVQTTAGEAVLAEFLSAARMGSRSGLRGTGLRRRDGFKVEKVPESVIVSTIRRQVPDEQVPQSGKEVGGGGHDGEQQRHWHVAVGGTFDHLHVGHKLLLTMVAYAVEPASAALAAETDADDFLASLHTKPRPRTLTIGITGDALLVDKKYASYLESWSERQRAVQGFLSSILDFAPFDPDKASPGVIEERNEPGLHGRAVLMHLPAALTVECVEISDASGPTITEQDISALVVSAETAKGGKAVNEKRMEKGWQELKIFEVDVLDAVSGDDRDAEPGAKERFDAKLSSTRIRQVRSEMASVLATESASPRVTKV